MAFLKSNSPAVKIGVGVLLGIAVLVLAVRILGGGLRPSYDPAANAATVKIVCSETGKSWEAEYGRLMDQLYGRTAPIDPKDGLASPFARGKHTGFPEDERMWKKLLAEANAGLAAAGRTHDAN